MSRILLLLALWGVFWNVENFFDWKDDGVSPSEAEFSARGKRHWTRGRFKTKCEAVGKVVLSMADRNGGPPELLCFAEVENALVLQSVANSSALHKLGYRHLHFDSPDRRGIDCGLLYRNVRLLCSGHCSIRDSSGAVVRTRDILWGVFESPAGDRLGVLVNHHPSKVGSGGEGGRRLALDRMNSLCDSLQGAGVGRILCVGDFNADVWNDGGAGTIKYHGKWEKIDGCFVRNLSVGEEVWDSPALLERDRKFGGMKPRRTYTGLKYNGGISDHLPLVFTLQ